MHARTLAFDWVGLIFCYNPLNIRRNIFRVFRRLHEMFFWYVVWYFYLFICFFIQRAFEALSTSTHLYGRRLVLEWAEEEDDIDTLRKRTAKHYQGLYKGITSIGCQKKENFTRANYFDIYTFWRLEEYTNISCEQRFLFSPFRGRKGVVMERKRDFASREISTACNL